jgi:hypothetical protein
MKTVDIAHAAALLADFARDSPHEPTIVTAGGNPVAAIFPLAEDTDLESLSLGLNRDFQAMIDRSRARHAAEGGISSDEMRRRLGAG